MKNMRVPLRPAPSLEDARRKQATSVKGNHSGYTSIKKKPPPRPPPPDFTKVKSKSAWNLSQHNDCLIDLSPPSSPRTSRTFGGSISSSFNSSTSSLASSKKSLEYDSSPFNINPWTAALQTSSQISVPTIIRPQQKKQIPKIKVPSTSREPSPETNYSPPMPSIPPPSPPKEVSEEIVPFGLALYNYPGSHPEDLPLQVNDIVYLIRRINDEWLYGKVGDRTGMFPSNFIEIKIPLKEEENIVNALYEFQPQMPGDLALVPGQRVVVLRKLSEEWLFGESNGVKGQFPSNFVHRIPAGI